jgi:uncharacterized RDD family membrane protein YckC
MASLSLAAASHASTTAIGPAVIVVIVIVVVWRFVIYKDGAGHPPGRLVACLLAMIVGWTLLAVAYPQAAESVASGAASGVVTLLGGIKGLVQSA